MSEKESILLDNEYHIMSEVADKRRSLSESSQESWGCLLVLSIENKMIREGLIKMTQ